MPDNLTPNLPANPSPTSPRRWRMAVRRIVLRVVTSEIVHELLEWAAEVAESL